jgi:hypothetical protein
MYADVTIETAAAAPVLAVPKEAVQNVGDRQVVYVSASNDAVTFTEREVRLGSAVGEQVEVLSGLSAGERIVSKGSFAVRAEAERLGVRAPSAAQSVRIEVTENGFKPDRVSLRTGIAAQLTFVRTTDKTCGTEVVFPSLSLKRALPLNEPVVIDFTPARTGEVAFTCGMNMLKGVVVVQ